MEKIDFNFDFTSDTKGFWDAYRQLVENHMAVLNGANYQKTDFVDPDAKSLTLRKYHKAVWSKPDERLANNGLMKLNEGDGGYLTCYLTVNGKKQKFRFSSDIIVTSLIGYTGDAKCQALLQKVRDTMLEQNYRAYVEGYTRKFYSNIGSFVLFPTKAKNGFNAVRGCHPAIRDRFDLTLECIRFYYQRQANPAYGKDLFKNENFRNLYKALFVKDNQDFFNLFADFRAYVDYFYLQDFVSADYTYVKDLTRDDDAPVQLWLGSDGNFQDPMPQTADAYLQWMNNQLAVIEKRTQRIQTAIAQRSRAAKK